MTKPSSGMAVRLLLLISAALVVLAVAAARGLSPTDLGLVWPAWGQVVVWLLLWVTWLVVTEAASKKLGFGSPEPWPAQRRDTLALKAAVVIVLAPLAEELVFRGLLFQRLESKLGAVAAVLITALLFSLLHLQYQRGEMAMIFLDGLVLGVARAGTGSVLLTALLHALSNAVAVYQRLSRRGASADSSTT